jgi:phosphate transport system substrate-binding protein
MISAWNAGGRRLAGAAALMLLVAGCSGPTSSSSTEGAGAALSGNVRIDGSSTVFPISQAIAEAFGEEHPDVRVPVSQNGTSAGMGKFLKKENDICDASRAITDAEKQIAKDAGIEYIELTVAYDGLAIVVNPQNTWCDAITVGELKAMWRPEADGEVTRWSQVNEAWPDEPLKLFGPGTASGTFEYFTEAICGEKKASRADYTRSENDNMLVRGVEGEKGALGYFGYAYYAQNKDKLKLVAVDGGQGPVLPSTETVLDGTYAPLSRPLYLYVNLESLKRPEVQTFLKFYLEHAGEMAEEVGYVAVKQDDADKDKETLAQAIAGLK